jgi:hypothetical protein
MDRLQTAPVAQKTKLSQDDRIRITNWVRERAGDLFRRRYQREKGSTPEAMALATDQAFLEFVEGKGPEI